MFANEVGVNTDVDLGRNFTWRWFDNSRTGVVEAWLIFMILFFWVRYSAYPASARASPPKSSLNLHQCSLSPTHWIKEAQPAQWPWHSTDHVTDYFADIFCVSLSQDNCNPWKTQMHLGWQMINERMHLRGHQHTKGCRAAHWPASDRTIVSHHILIQFHGQQQIVKKFVLFITFINWFR